MLVASVAAGGQAPRSAPSAFAPSTVQSAEPDTGVLIDLAIHTVKGDHATTVTAIRRDSAALIPLGAFLALAEVKVTRDTEGVVDFRLEPSGVRYTVDAASGTVTRNGASTPPAADALRVQGAKVYVETSQLAAWLGIRFEIAWSQLRITAIGDQVLPLQRRIARDAGRIIRPEEAPGQFLGQSEPLARPTLDGLVMDYALTLPLGAPTWSPGYVISTGLNVVGGALDGIFSAPTGGRLQSEISWTDVWDDSRL
ncbi:MAG TPA: hypothetical protein VMH39_02385, partial [Gemmatimonadaceae bacterium]|nr:hypothetical protein [Gemmatimonadaceae bacterium]